MDEEIERLVVSVRADTRGFARDVADIRGTLEGPLGSGVERAGALLETTLTRALRNGKLGFEDLKSVALSALSEIASASISAGVNAAFGGNSKGSGLVNTGLQIISALAGSPGRATGGPVSPGRAYLVGEQGPEYFVPTSSGSIATSANSGGRDVRVAISVNAPAGSAPDALGRSSRQIARAVRSALIRDE
jgi:phage-related minor tail protein